MTTVVLPNGAPAAAYVPGDRYLDLLAKNDRLRFELRLLAQGDHVSAAARNTLMILTQEYLSNIRDADGKCPKCEAPFGALHSRKHFCGQVAEALTDLTGTRYLRERDADALARLAGEDGEKEKANG